MLRKEEVVMDDNDSSCGDDDGKLLDAVERIKNVFYHRNLRRTAQSQNVKVAFPVLLHLPSARHCCLQKKLVKTQIIIVIRNDLRFVFKVGFFTWVSVFKFQKAAGFGKDKRASYTYIYTYT